MRHPSRPAAPVLLLALLACEQEKIDDDDTCAIAVGITGGFEAGLSVTDSVVCVVPFAFDAGIEVEYAPQDHPVMRLNLVVDGVTRGMTGADLPATVVVEDGDRRWTSAACTVAIDEHDFKEKVELGDQYRIRGAGECAAPLTADAAASIDLSGFEFVFTVTWGS